MLVSCDKTILLVVFVAKRKLDLGTSIMGVLAPVNPVAKISAIKETSLAGFSNHIITLVPFCAQD